MEPFWTKCRVRRAIIGSLFFVGPIFAAAGDPFWPQAWAILESMQLVYTAAAIVIMRDNPSLADERAKAIFHENTEAFDVVLMPIVVALMPVALWAAGLQRRLEPASFAVPFGWQLAAAPVLVAAHCLCACAMIENRFFSSVVRLQSDRGHAVCSTGPYAFVRHPGYTGFALQALAEAALLQSTWANYLIVARLVALVARTALEDRFLKRALPGYEAYARRVRWRLVPGVW